jgi:hypothetical protein
MIYLRPHITGSNDAILNEVGRTTAVSLWGGGRFRDHELCRGTALGHLLVDTPGKVSFGVWVGMTSRDWRLSYHKGQLRFHDRSLQRGGILSLWYYYGLRVANAKEHSYGDSFGYLSCLPRVPTSFRKPSGATL